ncbi:MAG: diphthine--ammonia ligase, partial [Candidatus Woesearchaeota archaeon]
MCGILGCFSHDERATVARRMFEALLARGKDGVGWTDGTGVEHAATLDGLDVRGEHGLGHVLHAVVGHEAQPLHDGKGFLVANCEVYNWESLAEQEEISVKNDAHLLLKLLDSTESLDRESVLSVLDRLDGVYAFAYWRDGKVVAARDVLGVKPLWFAHQDGFSFASEKKALLRAGLSDVADLNPRTVLSYDLKENLLSRWQRPFYEKEVVEKKDDDAAREVARMFVEAVKKRLPSKDAKVGVLFSGGVDSALIAKTCKDLGFDVTCYTAVVDNPGGKEPHDLSAAKAVAARYGFDHDVLEVSEEDIPSLAQEAAELVEEPHAVKVSVAMPFLVAARKAASDGCRVLFSGLGAEELYAGYQRHKDSQDVNDECLAGLLWLYERDLYRDDVVTMRQGVELRLPFLDRKLIEHSLSLPSGLKLKEGVEKYVLREAALRMGLSEEDAFRPKKAAQYGSRFDKALQKAAKKEGLNRAEYLRSLSPRANRRIGVLCSGGKDSWYAAHVMRKLNYDLACVLVVKSENDDSYMFHTPAIDLVRLQAESAGLPVMEQSTKGEKEVELDDLRGLLRRAKEEFRVDGVVTGALFSQYQRSRIERLCDGLGLKAYAPLWHLEQESELRELLREGFVITFSSVAGEGLSEEWLGKPIREEEVERLVSLRDSIGFNVAGEGGEYESLVLDCPLFSKALAIDAEPVMENRITGRLEVRGAWL